MKKAKVAVLGATGMVGQQYLKLLQNHPMFTVSTITGDKSVGKRYGDAVNWIVSENIPNEFADMEVQPTKPSSVDADLVFSPLPSEIAGRATIDCIWIHLPACGYCAKPLQYSRA